MLQSASFVVGPTDSNRHILISVCGNMKPILVVAHGDNYKHWCHTMGLNPRRDAIWVHNLDRVRGFRGLKWVQYGRLPQDFVWDLWRQIVASQNFQYVEPCNWSVISGHHAKISELQKELDYLSQQQASVIAMSRDI